MAKNLQNYSLQEHTAFSAFVFSQLSKIIAIQLLN